MPDGEITELVKIMASAMVEFPDDIMVREVVGEQTSVIELRVAKGDLGKIIGKKGRNAQALRTILSAVANKSRKRAVLEILD